MKSLPRFSVTIQFLQLLVKFKPPFLRETMLIRGFLNCLPNSAELTNSGLPYSGLSDSVGPGQYTAAQRVGVKKGHLLHVVMDFGQTLATVAVGLKSLATAVELWPSVQHWGLSILAYPILAYPIS